MKKSSILFLMMFVFGYSQAQDQPNIVLLFVDDYGWSDVGYRNSTFHTPHIDQLKSESLDFSRAYVTTPTCSPSRASLLTGKESIRMGLPRHIIDGDSKNATFGSDGSISEYNYWPTDPVQMPSRNWLPLEEITYAERLKEFGYYNMFIGKWHLGHEPYHPTLQGFDDYYGYANAGHPKGYYAPFFKHENMLSEFGSEDYLTDVLTDKAEDFIKNHDRKQPFMLSMWYYNVHGPHRGRKDFLEQYKKEGLEDRYANYAAMVSAMDESVGRVRQALAEEGLDKNTIIIFTSDQGGYFTNAPLSGGKTGGNTLGEGGARVPFMILYPGVTTPNTTTGQPIQTLDVYPTLIEIASGKKCKDTQINGVSLLPVLAGKKLKSRDLHFFRSYEDQYAAIMSGDWKLVKYHSGKYELFNIGEDISEQNNLIGQGLKQEQQLMDRLDRWEQEAVPVYN
ncbi:sulfatase [Reichenbachiella carrageenanivorans]|uniref:Sulfatase n=1 Tax=Reichenbachiella carrageenanivorans TaxID=2979869 RepID=A0ABY6D4K5_9BACT|nr:sulfatase [Reichenbachiella carrageenanivorans]UXX81089.1 sulfatase [Reichenbachiella carrageenanivorans]